MSDQKRTYNKLEQSSLRLALGDKQLRASIHCPQCGRPDAFNFNKLKNDNFGYRCESRTAFQGAVRPAGCGKTVASGFIHTAIYEAIGVDILASDDHLARVASAPSERSLKPAVQSSAPGPSRRAIVRPGTGYVPAVPTVRRPTVREISDQHLADARAAEAEAAQAASAQRLAEAELLASETDRQEEAELDQLRSPQPVNVYTEDWAESMETEECGTPYHNFSPAPEYRPVLGVRHSMHATAAERIRVATPPPASESFVPRASPVQDPGLSHILEQMQLENAALRAQIADLTKQLALFLSRENNRNKPAKPTKPAQPSTADAGREPEIPQSSAPRDAPPVHTDAPRAAAPPKRPRFTYSEAARRVNPNASEEQIKKKSSALQNLTSKAKKLPTADRLQLVYVGGILRKPIREVKRNLVELGFDVRAHSIANISFLGASTCELLMAPSAAAYFKRKIKELDCPSLRILENFDAAKAADPKASNALKSTLVNSYTKRIHSVIAREGASPEVKKFFTSLLAKQSLPLPAESSRDNADEIPLSATPMETDEQTDDPASDTAVEEEPTVHMETDNLPACAESAPAAKDIISSGTSEPSATTVESAHADATASTVPGKESESLLDIAPLQSNE